MAAGYEDAPYCTVPNEIPLATTNPAAGSSYVDPNFGGRVTTLTSLGYIHPYSLPSPLSARSKYLLVRSKDTGIASLLDPATGKILAAGVPYSSDGCFWDAWNDDAYYYVDGPRILRHTVSTNQDAVVVDYTGRFSAITTGGSSETSKDNWLAFWAPEEHLVCAVDLTAAATYCADYTAANPASRVGWGFIDYAVITKGVDSATGKRYVLLMADPALGMWSVNAAAGRLDFEIRGPENPEMGGNQDNICDPGEYCLGAPHADVFEDTDGKQYLVEGKGYNDPCAVELVTIALHKGQSMWLPVAQGGGRNAVLTLAQCGEAWPDYHVGCAKSAPYCVFSTFRNVYRSSSDISTPIPAEPHRDEIMVMRGNGAEVRRLAKARSVLFTEDTYYPQPRAAISNDGAQVVFDSDFGVLNGERVNVMGTGFGTATPAETPGPAAAPLSYFTLYPYTISGGQSSASNVVYLAAAAPADGTVVALSSSNPGVATVPSAVTVAPGLSSAAFTIATKPVAISVPVTITASAGGVTQTATLTVTAPKLDFFTVSQTTVTGGLATPSNIYLTSAAPDTGTVVTLTSSNPAAASVPGTITVPPGATSAAFTINTSPVTASTATLITASAGGVSQSVNLTVTPSSTVSSLTASSTTLTGGQTASGTVNLTVPAPAAGTVVTLTSSSPKAASVPGAVTVPSGATSAVFTIDTSLVSASTAVVITASAGGVAKTVTLTITPPTEMSSVSVSPATVTGGQTASGAVSLTLAAPAYGTIVTLTSSNPAAASVPGAVTVPSGATSAVFAINTSVVSASAAVVITASVGATAKTCTVTVTPATATLRSLGLSPATVKGGQPTDASVHLASPAPAGGITVMLSSSNSALAAVPATVLVLQGDKSASFRVTTVTVSTATDVVITASAGGVSQTATLTLKASNGPAPNQVIPDRPIPTCASLGGGTPTNSGPILTSVWAGANFSCTVGDKTLSNFNNTHAPATMALRILVQGTQYLVTFEGNFESPFTVGYDIAVTSGSTLISAVALDESVPVMAFAQVVNTVQTLAGTTLGTLTVTRSSKPAPLAVNATALRISNAFTGSGAVSFTNTFAQ